MSVSFENFNTKFNVDELLIAETTFWKWSLRPAQCTIGAGILSLKRPAEAMSDLTEEEGADLIVIVKAIESTLKSAFSPDKMNYLMLMMVDLHVHYHVIPRYSKDIEFGGDTFKDVSWPKPSNLFAESLDESVLVNLRDYLKSSL